MKIDNKSLSDCKKKSNELVENEVLTNNENQNNAIENEVYDNNIYMEKFNNVENNNNERYDEVTKQYYKEKIIDNRFKLTYVLARGGCGEIRATEDLVTGKEVFC